MQLISFLIFIFPIGLRDIFLFCMIGFSIFGISYARI